MRTTDLIKIAFKSLNKNRSRALLTMLGIIIGVSSVIAMLAIGKGSDTSIREQIGSLGTNMVMVIPGASSDQGRQMGAGTSTSLEEKDAKAIKMYCKSVLYVSPTVQTRAQVVNGQKNWQSAIMGVYHDYIYITNYKTSHGSMFDTKVGESLQKVCVIGRTVANKIFNSPTDAIGKTIRINKIPFVVIGVLAEKGQGTFGQDQDDIILAPFRTVQKRLMGINHVQQIVVSATNENEIDQAKKEITETLITKENKVKNGEPDFNLRSLSEITSIFGTITNVLTILLASIASISLLVGGIGIMNIMLVSVTERTREIGLRLAVGAPGSAILLQFLSEAIVLCLTGGLIGIFLGYGVTALVSNIMNWPVIISTSSILLAFGFASFVGIVFGYFPARKASRLNPIDALRYE
ncbi:MAG: ABC transporter permease [Bacteroidia bacterium]